MSQSEKILSIRRSSSGDQIHLAKWLIKKLGYINETRTGNKTVIDWYVSKSRNQAVLADDSGDNIDDLEYRFTSDLGIDVEDFQNGTHSGARVKIVTELPDNVLTELTEGDVVIELLYAEDLPIDTTLGVLSGAKEYDDATRPNRTIEVIDNNDEMGYRVVNKNVLPIKSNQIQDDQESQLTQFTDND